LRCAYGTQQRNTLRATHVALQTGDLMAIVDEDYTPDKIRFYLEHWRDLSAAAEGGTGSLAGRGAGGGNRMSLVALLADVERAADQLPLWWEPTMRVFRLQGRGRIWADRRIRLDDNHTLDEAIYRMARFLGWSGP
jgi:hypothetical protein